MVSFQINEIWLMYLPSFFTSVLASVYPWQKYKVSFSSWLLLLFFELWICIVRLIVLSFIRANFSECLFRWSILLLMQMLPTAAYLDNPSTSFAAKFVHTSLNKNRCSINRVLVSWNKSVFILVLPLLQFSLFFSLNNLTD